MEKTVKETKMKIKGQKDLNVEFDLTTTESSKKFEVVGRTVKKVGANN